MLQTLRRILRPSKSDSLAQAFSRLGWIGFWIQVAIGSIPFALITYAFIFGRDAGAGTRGGFAPVRYLAVAGLLVLAFTTLWSYWYTRIAKRIADAPRRPSEHSVRRAAWIGVAASAFGIVLSMLVMLFDRAAPDLFSPCAAGWNTRHSNHRRWTGKLDIRGRHRASPGAEPHHVR